MGEAVYRLGSAGPRPRPVQRTRATVRLGPGFARPCAGHPRGAVVHSGAMASGQGAPGRAGLRWNLLLAAAAVVLPLAGLECAARWLLPPTPPNAFPGLSASEVEDPQLLWRNRPGYAAEDDDGPIDAHGFRGDGPGDPDAFRIVSLGESTTFGSKVGWRETYSQRLEEILRAQGRRVEVINAGVRAWSTVQSVRFLELEIDALHPDLVLLYHEVNDFLPTTFRGVAMRGAGLTDAEMMERARGRAWLRGLRRHSRLVSGLGLAWARAQADETLRAIGDRTGMDVLLVQSLPYRTLPPAASGDERPWMDNPNPLVRVPDPERRAALERLVDLVRDRGARLVLLHPAYPVSRPHRCVLTEVAAQRGVPVLEVEDALAEASRASGRRRRDWFHANDPFHPDAAGHEAIARALASFLAKRDLLPEPSRPPGAGDPAP